MVSQVGGSKWSPDDPPPPYKESSYRRLPNGPGQPGTPTTSASEGNQSQDRTTFGKVMGKSVEVLGRALATAIGGAPYLAGMIGTLAILGAGIIVVAAAAAPGAAIGAALGAMISGKEGAASGAVTGGCITGALPFIGTLLVGLTPLAATGLVAYIGAFVLAGGITPEGGEYETTFAFLTSLPATILNIMDYKT